MFKKLKYIHFNVIINTTINMDFFKETCNVITTVFGNKVYDTSMFVGISSHKFVHINNVHKHIVETGIYYEIFIPLDSDISCSDDVYVSDVMKIIKEIMICNIVDINVWNKYILYDYNYINYCPHHAKEFNESIQTIMQYYWNCYTVLDKHDLINIFKCINHDQYIFEIIDKYNILPYVNIILQYQSIGVIKKCFSMLTNENKFDNRIEYTKHAKLNKNKIDLNIIKPTYYKFNYEITKENIDLIPYIKCEKCDPLFTIFKKSTGHEMIDYAILVYINHDLDFHCKNKAGFTIFDLKDKKYRCIESYLNVLGYDLSILAIDPKKITDIVLKLDYVVHNYLSYLMYYSGITSIKYYIEKCEEQSKNVDIDINHMSKIHNSELKLTSILVYACNMCHESVIEYLMSKKFRVNNYKLAIEYIKTNKSIKNTDQFIEKFILYCNNTDNCDNEYSVD